MKVLVTGLRGIPNVEGGIETHAEHLYPRVVKRGESVEVAVRRGQVPADLPPCWKGIGLTRFWAPRTAGLEALVHTALVIAYAAFTRPDLVHIHAVGPALLTPVARLLGLKVVVTHHGQDYEREKWGWLARNTLRLGEWAGMKYANARIVISRTIADLVAQRYGVPTVLIPNGVEVQTPSESTSVLAELGLTPGRYVLQVSRFVPEKRQADLIEAFEAAALDGWRLALVGRVDEGSAYGRQVLALAQRHPDVVLTGFRTGDALNALYANAGLFVLPSAHEGLPIAILEALSYGLRVIASDIPANLEVGLDREQYFPLGDAGQLADRLRQFGDRGMTAQARDEIRAWVRTRYDWDRIADDTVAVYRTVCG